MRRNDVLVLAAAAILFVVPALLLAFGDPPSKFGFPMASEYGVTTATWTDADGEPHAIDLYDHLVWPRVEVSWADKLPAQLCERLPDAVSVEVHQTARGGDRIGRATC